MLLAAQLVIRCGTQNRRCVLCQNGQCAWRPADLFAAGRVSVGESPASWKATPTAGGGAP